MRKQFISDGISYLAHARKLRNFNSGIPLEARVKTASVIFILNCVIGDHKYYCIMPLFSFLRFEQALNDTISWYDHVSFTTFCSIMNQNRDPSYYSSSYKTVEGFINEKIS